MQLQYSAEISLLLQLREHVMVINSETQELLKFQVETRCDGVWALKALEVPVEQSEHKLIEGLADV